jgi:site-specific recombinase XerD
MGIHKGGQLTGHALSEGAVLYLLQKRGLEAGLPHLSPHDCRRTFISNLLDAGVDLSLVSQLAGHRSLSTTVRYDRRGDESKRRAVDLLPSPF